MDVSQIIAHGDKFKRSGAHALAIRFYEKAMDACNRRDMAYILPRVTSCYRAVGRPQDAIDVLTYAKVNYDESIIDVPLLVSAAAAYCDMEEYDKAIQCCNIAYRKSGGKASEELKSVYNRISRKNGTR